MAIADLAFNFMNIFVGLMIIGVATDYAIYMLQRYVESPATFHKSAHETGKAILMAALTAIVGYGSFAFSHYPGLRSIGYASFFGIGLSGIAANTLLPAILVLGEAKHGNDDSAHPS
jgi:predicted RND superfamily exporter protein